MKLFKKKLKKSLSAFADGKLISLSDVHDPMFSAGLIGPGIAIESVDGKYYSPTTGTITMIFPTCHALGIQSDDGVELLLHIGIDTVNLKGEGFHANVANGQKVQRGDLLLDVDLSFVQEKGYDTEAILCITEPKDIRVQIVETHEVRLGEDILFFNHN